MASEDNTAAPTGSVLIVGVGASRGVGAAVARRFAREGYPVAIAGRHADKLAATAAELRASGAAVIEVVGDASKAEDARRFVAAAQGLAPLSVVVHNAGSNMPAPFLKVTEERFESHWREHTLGGFQTAQASIPVLLERGGGTLIFTGASGSLRGKANFAPFAAAKAGLRALAQSLAREMGPKGIHVAHVIVDGAIDGVFTRANRPDADELLAQERILKPEEIARNYVWLTDQGRSAWTHELDLRPWSESW